MYKSAIKLIICSAMLSGAYAFDTSSNADSNSRVAEISKELQDLQKEINSLRGKKEPENFLEVNRKGSFSSSAVTTSPTLGLRSQNNGGDLVVNFSTMNEDLRLLEQRKAYHKQREQKELSKPLLELSGALRGVASYSKAINGKSNTDVNLSQVELDGFAEVNRMVSGFFSLAYDDSTPGYSVSSADDGKSSTRISWANFYVKRGFITIGDLTQSNWYGSVGQMYVPFGKYSSYQVGTTLVSKLGKTLGRAATLGYKTKDAVATVYGMKGSTYTSSSNPSINAWGGNIQKNIKLKGDREIVVGAGFTSNLADSVELVGVVHSVNSGLSTDRYMISSYMPAYDVYAKLSTPDWAFNFEYINANKPLVISDTDYGRPAALQVEIDRMFNIGSVPASIAVGYGHIRDFVKLPEDSYAVSLNAYFFKDTIQSIEFRHMSPNKNTNISDYSYDKNSITAAFSLYF